MFGFIKMRGDSEHGSPLCKERFDSQRTTYVANIKHSNAYHTIVVDTL